MEMIIKEFDGQLKTLTSFSNSLKSLIESFLLNDGIEIHTITARVKDRKSLEKKIILKGRYSELSDITDIVGLRIITHYSDDVDRIAKIVEREFFIDKKNSIDKRASLDPDRFGYLSLHYVVGLKKDRLNLTEYSHFNGFKAEIQIRSILQHTWAEIEHDTGYKSNTGIPDSIRRRFSRLAGLLEIADDEFVEIKKALERHKIKIERDLKNGANNIPIDQVSLIEYINSSDAINSLAAELHEKHGFAISKKASENYLTAILLHLSHYQIQTIKDLDDNLKMNHENIFKLLSETITKPESEMPRQFIISYLTQVLAIKDGNLEEISKYVDILRDNKISHSEQLREILYKKYESLFK
ncbi:GTP pyrophosphokinase [Enterobacter mori]|uniref:GTP pyrophosphokinase n=1 Tax=Enterobacter mori TaxID=539813 RepID=UPI003D225420